MKESGVETESGTETESSTWEPVVWDCGSPLYDSYELASLAHLIERHSIAPPLDGSIQLTIPPTSSRTSGISNTSMVDTPSPKFSGFDSAKKLRHKERSKKAGKLCSQVCSFRTIFRLCKILMNQARVMRRHDDAPRM